VETDNTGGESLDGASIVLGLGRIFKARKPPAVCNTESMRCNEVKGYHVVHGVFKPRPGFRMRSVSSLEHKGNLLTLVALGRSIFADAWFR